VQRVAERRPTAATVKVSGAGQAMLSGFSSSPGSQAMTNCPGCASIASSNTKVATARVSRITSAMRAARGSCVARTGVNVADRCMGYFNAFPRKSSSRR
jgi:hypothetical protein